MELKWDGRAAQTTWSPTRQEMLAVPWTPGGARWREQSRAGQVPTSREHREGQRAPPVQEAEQPLYMCTGKRHLQTAVSNEDSTRIHVCCMGAHTKSWKPLTSLNVANIGRVR